MDNRVILFQAIGYLIPVSIVQICPILYGSRKSHKLLELPLAFLFQQLLISYSPSQTTNLIIHPSVMPAISLAAHDQTMHQLVRRENWASHNAGVVLVFCIVFIVATGLITLFIYRKWTARKAGK